MAMRCLPDALGDLSNSTYREELQLSVHTCQARGTVLNACSTEDSGDLNGDAD